MNDVLKVKIGVGVTSLLVIGAVLFSFRTVEPVEPEIPVVSQQEEVAPQVPANGMFLASGRELFVVKFDDCYTVGDNEGWVYNAACHPTYAAAYEDTASYFRYLQRQEVNKDAPWKRVTK